MQARGILSLLAALVALALVGAPPLVDTPSRAQAEIGAGPSVTASAVPREPGPASSTAAGNARADAAGSRDEPRDVSRYRTRVAGAGPATKAPALGSGNAYSVGFRSRLPQSAYPGRSRAHHYQEANRDLAKAMDEDAAFAGRMEEMIPGLRSQLRSSGGGISRRPPEGWSWHHAADEGVMQLVPRVQHRAPGRLQELLHPGGRGGFSTWGSR